jgi:hypothetical protein
MNRGASVGRPEARDPPAERTAIRDGTSLRRAPDPRTALEIK